MNDNNNTSHRCSMKFNNDKIHAKAKDIMTKQGIGGTLAILSLLEELKDRQSQSILTMMIVIK
jgi:hypothetical protein